MPSTELVEIPTVIDAELDWDDDDYDFLDDDASYDGESMMALMNLLFGGGSFLNDDEETTRLKEEARSTGKASLVFDWNKAAQRIAEVKPTTARAGLTEDFDATQAEIIRNGVPTTEDDDGSSIFNRYLASWWATPVLVMDGVEEDCFTELAGSDYGAQTFWPAEALAVVTK